MLRGPFSGDGPWKVGDAVIRVLGCQHTDPHLQTSFAAWQGYLQNHGDEYPQRRQIIEIARRLGAEPSDDGLSG